MFILHGRTQQYSDYEKAAYAILSRSYSASYASEGTFHGRGLLVVMFDQRNHGHRKVSDLANLTWTDNNPTHAQDMFSIYYGTAQDVSLLVNLLPCFLFPKGEVVVESWICSGISLGGHATYVVLSDDDRVKAGVVIIGCPDYKAIMSQRAALDGGSVAERMPEGFMKVVEELGPRIEKVGAKDVLILKGDEDALVPWSASEEWVSKLPKERAEVVGYPGVGHAFPEAMKEKLANWINDWRLNR